MTGVAVGVSVCAAPRLGAGATCEREDVVGVVFVLGVHGVKEVCTKFADEKASTAVVYVRSLLYSMIFCSP